MTEKTLYNPNSSTELEISFCFNKFPQSKSFTETYNILLRKERRKTTFICQAILYYINNAPNNYFEESILTAHLIDLIKEKYSIPTKEDLALLLTKYINKNNEKVVPRRVCCKFKSNSEDMKKVYQLLKDLSTDQRLQFLAKAVNFYIYSGQDEEELNEKVDHLLSEMASEYQNSNDKKAAAEKLFNRFFAKSAILSLKIEGLRYR